MNRKVLSILGGLLLSFTVHAASFDCAQASAKVENIICGDAELSKLDEELSTTYKTCLQDAKHAKAIKESQRIWLREVRTGEPCYHTQWLYSHSPAEWQRTVYRWNWKKLLRLSRERGAL